MRHISRAACRGDGRTPRRIGPGGYPGQVLTRIDLRGKNPARLGWPRLADMLPRARLDVEAALEAVRPVCDDVRLRGAAAVRDQTKRFDGVDLATTRIPPSALRDALAGLGGEVRAALLEAARRARLVHEAQRPRDTVTAVADGATVTERYVPVGRAGVYVPGGLVAYPSSVVMNVIPAQVAGVAEIAVASPPRPERGGLPHPAVLAACALLGVSEVHAAGGAQAIAMFGYGTADCAPADIVSGPGNVYVAAAKRLLQGRIGTDAKPARPRSRSSRITRRTRCWSRPTWSRRPSTTRWPRAC